MVSALMGHGMLLSDAFDQFDTNNDQSLDEEEVAEMLEFLGFAPTADDVLDFIEDTDLDSDGRVSFKEFQRRLRATHRNLPVGAGDNMLVKRRTNSLDKKKQLEDARQRRRIESEMIAMQIESLKREQLAQEEEAELGGDNKGPANPAIEEDHIVYSFLTKGFPNRVQCVRGRGEPIADQLHTNKKGKTTGQLSNAGEKESPLSYFLRLDNGACMRVPVVGKAVDRLASYTVTLIYRVRTLPSSRFPLFTASRASVALLPNGLVGVHSHDRVEKMRVLTDPAKVVKCPNCTGKKMHFVPQPGPDQVTETTWKCQACDQDGSNSDHWICAACDRQTCVMCVRAECTVRENRWAIASFVVDAGLLTYYLNGTAIATLEVDESMSLTAEEVKIAGKAPRDKKDKWLFVGLFGDVHEKNLCQGCDVRIVRVDTQPLHAEGVLTLHAPNGAWLCPVADCKVRNSPSSMSCVACSKEKKLSGVAPPNDMDPDHPGLRIVVADTFERIVLDNSKHVFLDVTGDWCGPSR
jgi:hypothetical protein